ncbi:MAG: peptidylprolyl isomerase [Gaiellales bacterium]
MPTPESVPSGSIAIVGDTGIEQSTYDQLIAQRETAVVGGGGEFPTAGTPEFETIKNQAVQFLVQREEFRQEADAVGISVTDDDLQGELDSLKDQFFDGDDERYQAELERQKLTEEQVLGDIEVRLVQDALFAGITADVTVSDDEIQTYYDEHSDDFTSPESRNVAHILVADKAEADDLYQQLQGGADFAELAAANSIDTGTANNGGEYVAVRGQSVPEFEEAAYSLQTGEISEPVKTQFGWHIITALDDVVPERVQSVDQVSDQINGLLRRDAETARVAAWVDALDAKYAGKVLYAPGFEPPPTGAALQDGAPAPESP